MDWKRLIQFALSGSGDLEQYAILLVRVSIGLFFAISGANKLFVAGGTLVRLLQRLGNLNCALKRLRKRQWTFVQATLQ